MNTESKITKTWSDYRRAVRTLRAMGEEPEAELMFLRSEVQELRDAVVRLKLKIKMIRKVVVEETK